MFYGKANFNYDKGAENVYGFTSAYDAESWEFCNNTSDACNFTGSVPDNWADDFEARYPDESTNITRFRAMHDWVVSTNQHTATNAALASPVTIDGTQYATDSAEYRLAKFKDEFETIFNLHYSLIYYVWTFVALMVDQRSKNMFLTYWGGDVGKWYPYFYDNDTCFGINNEGQLVFDYYHEDTDQLNGANVYNGYNSVLWENFREAFADDIKSTYQGLRSSGKITLEALEDRFITQGSDMWSESIYNEDADFKYISMLRSDNDASNLYQVRGDGELHFKYFIDNRLRYCDSKWYGAEYADDIVSLRIYTPDSTTPTVAAVAPNADITVTPYSNMYAGVRYKANGTLQQIRAEKNEAVTFNAPNEIFNDTETAIYGASSLSSLGDLAPLYCGTINVSKAAKLVSLKIGDETSGYSNPNLTSLSVGTNRLLKTIDIRNCPNLTAPLGLSHCPNIENIYAEGSGITGVELPDSGYLKIVHLPDTITNLTLKNQLYINDFVYTPTNLKTLWVENCPTIDSVALIQSAPTLERVRLTDVEWDIPDVSFLRSLYGYTGIDENGLNTDFIHVSGACHITTLTGAEMAEINERFPYLTITYTNLSATLTFKNEQGTSTLATVQVLNGGNATYPNANPTKASTAQYNYTFDGWSLTVGGARSATALQNVTSDRTVYAHFKATIRSYQVRFYNDTVLLQTSTVNYGSNAVYTGSTPVNAANPDYEFSGWNPSPNNITGNRDCYAMFVNPNGLESKTWAEIAQISADGTGANFFSVGDCKSIPLNGTVGTVALNSSSLYAFILEFNHNSEVEGNGISFGTFKNALTNGKNLCLVDAKYNSGVTDGSKYFNMNHWGNYNYGGWSGSDFRYDILGSTKTPPSGYGSTKTTSTVGYDAPTDTATDPVPNTLMAALPSDLRAVMKPMTIYTNNVGGSGDTPAKVTATVDYLPLAAEFEIFGARSYANSEEKNHQTRFAYYASGNSKVKYGHSATGSAAIWWLRSPSYYYYDSFCYVYTDGYAYSNTANRSLGVAPVFKV